MGESCHREQPIVLLGHPARSQHGHSPVGTVVTVTNTGDTTPLPPPPRPARQPPRRPGARSRAGVARAHPGTPPPLRGTVTSPADASSSRDRGGGLPARGRWRRRRWRCGVRRVAGRLLAPGSGCVNADDLQGRRHPELAGRGRQRPGGGRRGAALGGEDRRGGARARAPARASSSARTARSSPTTTWSSWPATAARSGSPSTTAPTPRRRCRHRPAHRHRAHPGAGWA